MEEQKGKVFFEAGLDNSGLQRQADEAKKILSGIGQTAEQEGQRIDDMAKRLGTALAGVFTVVELKKFATEVATVRGEFQKLEIAFKTMLGSEEKANDLMAQLTKTAMITPFGMSDIANSAKQLLAYGLEAEKVNDTLIRLGDIAAGLSIPINDLAYLYGTTMVQGRMYTQDLNQFLGRGIPIMGELAKQFGVAESKVKDLVQEGKIGFPQVEQAIIALTSEGSKFGGLMAAQAETISGQISNLEDQIEQIFNTLGQRSEGVINNVLSMAGSILEHWEEIGKVLITVIAAYGSYKAAVLAVAAAHKLAAVWGEVQAFLSLTKAVTSAKDAMLLLNMATKANPIGLVLSVLATAATAFALFGNKTDKATDALKAQQQAAEEFNKSVGEAAAALTVKYKALQEEYSKCKTAHEKREWISKSQGKFKDLGIAVKGVTDAENIFVKNTTAMLNAFKLRAEAAAWQTKVEALYAKRVERQLQLEQQRAKIKAGTESPGASHDARTGNEQVDRNGKWVYTEKGAAAARAKLTEANDASIKAIDAEINNYSARVVELNKKYASSIKEAGSTTKTELTKEQKQEAQRIADATADRLSKLEKYREAVIEATKAAELDIEAARIGAMDEGYAKTAAQIKLNYDRLIAENEQREKDMINDLADARTLEWQNKNPKATKEQTANYRAGLNLSATDLTPDQQAMLAAYKQAAEEARQQAEKSLKDDTVENFGSFEQKLKALREKWETIIGQLPAEYTAEATKQMNEAVSAFIVENKKGATILTSLFEDLEKKTSKELQSLLKDAQAFYDFISGGNWDSSKGEEFGITKEQFETLRQSPEELEKIRKGIEDVKDAAFEAQGAFGQFAQALKDTWEAGGDTSKAQKGMSELQSAVGELDKVINFLGNTFTELGDSFANETLATIGEAFGDVSDALTSTMEGALAGFLVGGPIGAAVGAAVGLGSKLVTTINKWIDKKHEKAIAALQGSIDTLGDSYDRLNDAIDKAYSSSKQQLYDEQNENLKKQNELINQQIEEEQSKKGASEEAIANYRKQIEENNRLIEQNKESAVDALFGADIQSAISDFEAAVTDAWANNESASENARETVTKMMRNMVSEAIKDTIQASAAMERIRAEMQKAFSDKIITAEERERLEQMAEELANEIESQYGWADGMFGDEASRSASEKGIATASQESIDELNGRMTAVQSHTFNISENSNILVDTSNQILAAVLNINDNAESIERRLAAVEAGVRVVREVADDISMNGIKIK